MPEDRSKSEANYRIVKLDTVATAYFQPEWGGPAKKVWRRRFERATSVAISSMGRFHTVHP